MKTRASDPVNVGELLMVGIPGTALDARTRRALLDIGTRSVILFARNARSPSQLRRLCSSLHHIRSDFVIGIDHEGGRVNRLPPPFTRFPPARSIGRTENPRVAFEIGRAIGRELVAVGIDVDFAPVFDVLTHPRNRVIGDRAYGTEPKRVTEMALAFTRGLHAAGVMPCAKHFPGHGAARGDSHVVLPRVTTPARELRRVHLAPFRAAVKAKVPSIMVAHVVYRELDPACPASLSPKIVHGLLRKNMGYRGLIVTDDLEMGAVANRQSPEEVAVQAVLAGADLLLVCKSLEVAHRARAGLEEALSTGRLPSERVRDAIRRLRALRPSRSGYPPIRRWPVSAHAALAERIG